VLERRTSRGSEAEGWVIVVCALKGIARVDPEHMPVNRVAPQVVVERVS